MERPADRRSRTAPAGPARAQRARRHASRSRAPTRHRAGCVAGPTANLLGPVTTSRCARRWDDRKADLTGAARRAMRSRSSPTAASILARNRFDELKLDFVLLKPGAIAPNLSGRDVRALVDSRRRIRAARRSTITSPPPRSRSTTSRSRRSACEQGARRFDRDHIMVPVAATARAITGLDTVAGGTSANVRLDGDLAGRLAAHPVRQFAHPLGPHRRHRDRPRRTSQAAFTPARSTAGSTIIASTASASSTSRPMPTCKTRPAAVSSWSARVRARSTQLVQRGVRNFLGGNAPRRAMCAMAPTASSASPTCASTRRRLRITDGSGSYAADGQINLRASGMSQQYGPVGVAIAGTIEPTARVAHRRPAGTRSRPRQSRCRRSAARPNGYRLDATGDHRLWPASPPTSLVRTASGPLTIDIRRGDLAGIDFSGTRAPDPSGTVRRTAQRQRDGLGGIVRLAAAGQYQAALINLRATRCRAAGAGATSRSARRIVDARRDPLRPAAKSSPTSRSPRRASARLQHRRAARATSIIATAAARRRRSSRAARACRSASPSTPICSPTCGARRCRAASTASTSAPPAPARIIPRDGTTNCCRPRSSFDRGSMRLAGSLRPRASAAEPARIASTWRCSTPSSPDLGLGGRATGSVDFEQAGERFPARRRPARDPRLHPHHRGVGQPAGRRQFRRGSCSPTAATRAR